MDFYCDVKGYGVIGDIQYRFFGVVGCFIYKVNRKIQKLVFFDFLYLLIEKNCNYFL